MLTEFVKAGAPEEILYVAQAAHRHLPPGRHGREPCAHEIESLGGEIRFQQRVTDVLIDDGPTGKRIRGVTLASGETHRQPITSCWRSATARATPSRCCTRAACYIEAKPFSIGFRIEHPQSLIDRCRFGRTPAIRCSARADYKLVHHCRNGRSVYSFCMCPGGTVVAATSEPGRVVTNGMSQYSRNERNANAGIVVGITPADFRRDHPLAGIALQRKLEESARSNWAAKNYNAPAQLVGDFLAGRPSTAARRASSPRTSPACT